MNSGQLRQPFVGQTVNHNTDLDGDTVSAEILQAKERIFEGACWLSMSE
jgi:hypothetical protein